MWDPRRLLTLLGVGAAAAVTALVLPMSAAQAAPGPIPGWGEGPFETCNGAVCMVMEPLTRESLENWSYEGIRPFITDWKGEQLYNIEYTPEGSEESTLAGSYNIQIEDFWNSFFSSSAYQFGDFVANPDLAEALDPMLLGNFGYLSGSSIYEVTIGDFTNLTMNGIGPHDMNYWVMSFGDLSYTVATDPNNFASAGYFQTGDDDPIQLWNSLWHPWAPGVPDYLIPNDPFAELDFDPADFFDSDALAWF